MTGATAATALECAQNPRTVAILQAATLEWTRSALLGVLGYGLLAGITAAAVAFGYRARTVRDLPAGPALLVGLAVPATWLTLTMVRRDAIVGAAPLSHYSTGAYLLGVSVAGAVAAESGRRIGDHLARGVFEIATVDASGPVAELLRSAGLAVVVTLPETIDDVAGYPPVEAELERELAGRRLLFPGRLSIAELESRLRTRLETDYDLGYARVDVAEDGTVDALALGRRRSGIGPTLPPGRVAVTVRGNSAPTATVGDPVEVWTADEETRLVTTGTFRASAGRATTLVVDEDDADAFDLEARYRLTTQSATPTDAHEFGSVVRAADETVVERTVEAGGPLESEFAGWVPGTVLAIDRDESVLSLPPDSETLRAGDTLYVFGEPTTLERIPTANRDEPRGADASREQSGIEERPRTTRG